GAPVLEESADIRRVYIAVDGRLAAVATVRERLRDSVPDALARFAMLGLPVEVLTGDLIERARALGLPSPRGGLLPGDKLAAVEEAKRIGGRPLFVGDGINDGPALAAAHIGVALASGTDLAVSAAPVTLYGGDLRALPRAIELCREAVRAVSLNIARALAYNLVGIALAAGGVLHPVVAAVLMVVSSLTLVFSSTRVGCHSGWEKQPTPGPLSAGKGLEPSLSGPRSGPEERKATVKSGLHAVAFGLQGVCFLLLVEAFRTPVAGAFVLIGLTVAGIGLAMVWQRAGSHQLDMAVGMLTAGNLGMLLGWWADNSFTPLAGGGNCRCLDSLARGDFRPWMWVGMLAFANLAMRFLRHTSAPTRDHAVAMYTGGNAGMIAGMLAGGWVASLAAVGSLPAAFALGFAAMNAGMLGGMFAGTWVAESLLAGLRAIGPFTRAEGPKRVDPEPVDQNSSVG
ncbi:MAG: HAD-IC family P-type ATPase, partial [Gemmataceae bacterium]|nr:HAD-IC family P-type ATPase [Gemmataceae bacterium]